MVRTASSKKIARRSPAKRKRNVRALLNYMNDSDDEFMNSLIFDSSPLEALEIKPTWEDPSFSNTSLVRLGWDFVRSTIPNPFSKRRVSRSIEVAAEPDVNNVNKSDNYCSIV